MIYQAYQKLRRRPCTNFRGMALLANSMAITIQGFATTITSKKKGGGGGGEATATFGKMTGRARLSHVARLTRLSKLWGSWKWSPSEEISLSTYRFCDLLHLPRDGVREKATHFLVVAPLSATSPTLFAPTPFRHCCLDHDVYITDFGKNAAQCSLVVRGCVRLWMIMWTNIIACLEALDRTLIVLRCFASPVWAGALAAVPS